MAIMFLMIAPRVSGDGQPLRELDAKVGYPGYFCRGLMAGSLEQSPHGRTRL